MKPKLKIIDLFCGAGGFTSGALAARDKNGNPICEVIAGVNHDPIAIASHKANHPETVHFIEDVRNPIVIEKIAEMVRLIRINEPDAIIGLHGSLECTHFSIAKGGDSRCPDSRSLPEYMPFYVEAIRPDYFTVENVKEFLTWGDLVPKQVKVNGYDASVLRFDKKAQKFKPHLIPESKSKGTHYVKWVEAIKSLGYEYDYKILNSADFGAYTARPRYFGVFAVNGLPIKFPQQTHEKKPKQIGGLQKWRPIKHCLELDDKGTSIFNRKKPIVEKTLERLLAGLVKHIGNNDYSFIMKYYSSNKPEDKCVSLDVPASTITTFDHHAIVNFEPFVFKYVGNNQKTGINNGKSIHEPSVTVTTQNRLGLVTPEFISAYYGNGHTHSVDAPCPVLTTKDRMAYVTAEQFISYQFSQGGSTSVEEPNWSITTKPKEMLVSPDFQYLMSPHFKNVGKTLDNPAPTIVASKRYDYLVTTESGELSIRIDEHDSITMRKIKLFMAHYGIVDIKMRMLKVSELKKIQGFPKDYVLLGNTTEQKKFIGNSVENTTAKKLVESIASAAFKHLSHVA